MQSTVQWTLVFDALVDEYVFTPDYPSLKAERSWVEVLWQGDEFNAQAVNCMNLHRIANLVKYERV